MGEIEMIPALELDKAAVSQVFIRHLTDSSLISQTIASLQKICESENLHNTMSPWIEYSFSRVNHEDFVKRESSRPIGYTGKIRIVLAVANDLEADLIIVSNRELVTVQEIFNVYKSITSDSPYILSLDEALQKCGSFIPPKWGVPNWNNSTVFSRSYRVNLTDLDLKEFSSASLDRISSALLMTLEKYGAINTKILIEENDMETKQIRTGTFDDNKHLKIKEDIFRDDRELNAFDAGIMITDLPDMNCQYSPCLSPLFPVTVIVTKYNGALHSISMSASERFVHPTVLRQFVDLFCFNLENKDGNNNFLENECMSLLETESNCINHTDLELLERFHSVAISFPDQIAISGIDGSITYAELNRKSDVIAKKLISYGMNLGDKIIVSLDQTVELVVIMVAIVKAGGTYIPVDPNYPLERISFVIEDSQATHIITGLPDLPAKHAIHWISPSDLIEGESDVFDTVVLPTTAPDTTYIIYTSGTSGQPKGVMVPSKNVVSLIEATSQEFKLSHIDVWTMFHSASFDFSVWEMWGCLLTGGHLVVVSRQVARSPYDFYDLLVEKKVTVLNQTPSAFYTLLKVDIEQRNTNLTSIRLVIFGGEALDPYKLSEWLERYPVSYCRLVNMYGITETTVHVTYRNILHRDPEFLSKSVGVTLPGWKISIRDTNGIPCLYGMEGEIWVGGAGLSNGYHNREELNKKFFVIDPKDDQRWYRSGDLGRKRPDGSIDYLGRIDTQVKIRGFRIELDEIRSVIQKIPFVRNVAIVLHDGDDVESSQKQIVAFIESLEHVDADTVRSDLKSKIPEYMIPARIVRVNEIPMTINGKVDNATLMLKLNHSEDQDVDSKDNNSQDSYLSIWNKVLGHSIAAGDNFFESGGNSLLAVELLSALKREMDSSLTLRDLYIHSSPNALKEFLSKKPVR
ncbi:non-ribosomal peptide synthetase [Paenibacillus wynnii]|uniref:non-ribosomal peptide synthetase n=1 Tax=Paenibacillus wynnii TaxID=268407 RepID=UPI00279437D1|nr:non-ribosomal peptide synthetase [Paenibacillus wynnii]MDQ0195345.1 amino acid adenylation domain-containing protein [Paenibacillus wynnii]